MARNLIIYYSRKGENYWNGGIKNIAKGNTEVVAEFIQNAVGGDLFEVDTVKPYAADYYACIEEVKQELRAQARPTLKKYLGSIDGSTTTSSSAAPAGGAPSPWPCSPSWKNWISPAKR